MVFGGFETRGARSVQRRAGDGCRLGRKRRLRPGGHVASRHGRVFCAGSAWSGVSLARSYAWSGDPRGRTCGRGRPGHESRVVAAVWEVGQQDRFGRWGLVAGVIAVGLGPENRPVRGLREPSAAELARGVPTPLVDFGWWPHGRNSAGCVRSKPVRRVSIGWFRTLSPVLRSIGHYPRISPAADCRRSLPTRRTARFVGPGRKPAVTSAAAATAL